MIDELRNLNRVRWIDDDPIRSWGPAVDTMVFNRSDHVLELIAEWTDEDPGDIADKLLAEPELRRYVLIETLAQTPASTVIAAVDRILARAVAVKISHTQEFFVRR